jgi:hypothetical protein
LARIMLLLWACLLIAVASAIFRKSSQEQEHIAVFRSERLRVESADGTITDYRLVNGQVEMHSLKPPIDGDG